MSIEKYLHQGINLAGQGMLRQALLIFEKILMSHPEEPRALFNAAVVLDLLGQQKNALDLLHRSMNADPLFASPHYYLGRLYLQNGCYNKAYQAFRDTIARDVEFTAAYEGIQVALSSMEHTIVADKADIVFYTGGYPFHGRTMEERGLGGSESALIYMARALAAKGIRVRVFCNCDKPGVYEGVRYDNLVDFYIYSKLCKFPVLVSSRSLRPFKIALELQTRILWIHDDINAVFLEDENPKYLPIDRIFAISRWQRDEWSRHFGIPIEQFFLTRNGVDLSIFKSGERRSRYRLIYVSRPARGLDVLLRLFPCIRQRVPDAELHVYAYQLPGDKLDDQIYQLAQQPGVYMRGSVTKVELAEEMSLARLMVYPSTFRETSCIAAIESQAAGTPVVASALAALSETVVDDYSGCLIPGDPHTIEFGHRFIETIVTLMNDDESWQRLSSGARHRAEVLYNWNIIANDWLNELCRLVDKRNVINEVSSFS